MVAKQIPDQSPELAAKKSAARVAAWLKEIDAAKEREKKYIDQGRRVVGIYENARDGRTSEAQVKRNPFNILYANTEVLGPSLYNVTPRVNVAQRFKTDDPLGALAAKLTQGTLEYLVDVGYDDQASYDECLNFAVLQGLVPGRGVVRFRYDDVQEEAGEGVQDEAAEAGEHQPIGDETDEEHAGEKRIISQTVFGEEVPWDYFHMGYAKRWKDVPWIAFDHFMSREECIENFGEDLGSKIQLTETANPQNSEADDKKQYEASSESIKLALIQEIWDKRTRKVTFVSPGYKDAPVKETDDPYGLTGFYPCSQPMVFFPKISTLTPTPLYIMYEEQATELNEVTVRITKIIRAMKVRGFYNPKAFPGGGLEQLFESADNAMVPLDGAGIQPDADLDKGIWLFPLEKLVGVLQQLYAQREQIKGVIYEIMGLADIMRGQSQASETLGAQKLKTQFGSLRLKRMQKVVAIYARSCLRIMGELAMSKFTPETITAMTGVQLPTRAQQQQAKVVVAQIKQQAMGQPGGTPPQIPPAIQMAVDTPTWEDVLPLLQSNLLRSFRIDIETNSTVDAEATEDKQNVAEFLNAMAQFLNGIAPVVESGALPAEAAQAIMLAIVRKFRFGVEVEDSIKKMQPPQQKTDPEAQAKVQAAQLDLQIKQAELELKKQEGQMKLQQQQAQLQLDQAKMGFEQQKLGLEQQRMVREHEMAVMAMGHKATMNERQHALKMRMMEQKAAQAVGGQNAAV